MTAKKSTPKVVIQPIKSTILDIDRDIPIQKGATNLGDYSRATGPAYKQNLSTPYGLSGVVNRIQVGESFYLRPEFLTKNTLYQFGYQFIRNTGRRFVYFKFANGGVRVWRIEDHVEPIVAEPVTEEKEVQPTAIQPKSNKDLVDIVLENASQHAYETAVPCLYEDSALENDFRARQAGFIAGAKFAASLLGGMAHAFDKVPEAKK